MCLSVKSASSIDESKAQIESKPMKCKILHWIHKYTNKWRTAKIPLDSKDQPQDSSLSMVCFSPLLILHLFYSFYA